jgi:hypothetical protein
MKCVARVPRIVLGRTISAAHSVSPWLASKCVSLGSRIGRRRGVFVPAGMGRQTPAIRV